MLFQEMMSKKILRYISDFSCSSILNFVNGGRGICVYPSSSVGKDACHSDKFVQFVDCFLLFFFDASRSTLPLFHFFYFFTFSLFMNQIIPSCNPAKWFKFCYSSLGEEFCTKLKSKSRIVTIEEIGFIPIDEQGTNTLVLQVII